MNHPSAAPKHQARKRFGQHFLHDQQVISQIVDAIDPQPDDALIEIGPGLGALTRPLLQRAGRLEVIELDRDVIPHLTAACGHSAALKIHMADVLEVDFRSLAGERLLRLCGNLPYNISTPLLFHLLQSRSVIRDMTFMLQKEVVLRMAAEPDTGDYGRLTVMLSAYCTSVRLFDVGPRAFRPPPKVDSSIVRVVPHEQPPFAINDQARFAAVVAAAFGQRRKTLRNSLSGVVDAAAFESTGINPGRRAETLGPAEFAALANAPSRPDPELTS